ncbi:MAG: restriction endonuclease [Chloroflexota bacterium]
MTDKQERIARLHAVLPGLTDGQLDWLERVAIQFGKPYKFERLDDSDLVTPDVLQDFGDALRIHHCFSSEAFSKDKFEYALARVAKLSGIEAELAPKGNPGHDITINGQAVSLKTEAAKAIKADKIHISKFMELGKGDWSDRDDDLVGLRQRFFDHMQAYERIFTLRRLLARSGNWCYELVEIPKALLLEAESGRLEMRHSSTQMPKPGYCYVTDENGEDKFQLYFDGGTERKLQIKQLQKHLCIVHATWRFETG